MKTLLITGGTGFFGKNYIRKYLSDPQYGKIIVFSRDEHKQIKMQSELGSDKLRFIIGDIKDEERVRSALRNVDEVIHTAALKSVPTCEYNPGEATKTNIFGTYNIIWACILNGVEKATLISTDKAVYPINLYGSTKAAAEKLWMHSNIHAPIFQIVRYGNVANSTGSIIPKWKEIIKQSKETPLPITDTKMTRFWIDINEAITFVHDLPFSPETISIPKMKSFNLVDLAMALNPKCTLHEIGIRNGEKLHESIITQEELSKTVEKSMGSYRYYQIRQSIGKGDIIVKDIEITSENTTLTVKDLKKLLKIKVRQELI